MEKLKKKAATVLQDEEHMKAEGRGEISESELLILDEFTILVRDLYAFYPLLIRFVDYNRYERQAQVSCDWTGTEPMMQRYQYITILYYSKPRYTLKPVIVPSCPVINMVSSLVNAVCLPEQSG